MTKIILITLAAMALVISPNEASSVSQKFMDYKIVPDVIKNSPKDLVELKYGKLAVNLGTRLTPTQVKDPPTYIHWPAEPDTLYTLIETDPDAPSRTNHSLVGVKHWLVVNIPGTKLDKGDVLAEYVGSGPPKGSGFHRYIFLVYKQSNGKIEDPKHGHITKHMLKGRYYWKAEEFVEKHKLQGPIAGNFYEAEYDDYVPIHRADFEDPEERPRM